MTLIGRVIRRSRGAIALLFILGLIVFVEGHHQIPAFRAWTFGLISVFFATATFLARGAARNALLALTTAAFCLCVLDVAAEVLEPKTDFFTTPNSLVANPVVGWVPGFAGVQNARKRDPKTGTVIFDVDYTIDADLDRAVKSATTGPAVVFFGDSYTFGVGVGDADTMPQRFADLFGGKQRVLNLGISGYSPQQFLREVQTGFKDAVIGPQPAYIIYLTSPFHAKRVACKESWVHEAPRYALVDGKPVLAGRCYAGFDLMVQEFLENTALYRLAFRPYLTRLTPADVDLYIAVLAEAVKVSKAKYGVDTLVPFVRVGPDYLAGTGYDDDRIINALKSRGVRVVDMTLPDDPAKGLVYAIKGDGHPTPLGHKVRARIIADTLLGLGVPLASPIVQLSEHPGEKQVTPQ